MNMIIIFFFLYDAHFLYELVQQPNLLYFLILMINKYNIYKKT